MDRVSQLRGGAGPSGSGDSTLDTTSPPSEAYLSANESSKYFSFADSSFDISPIKDVSLASTSADSEPPNTDRQISDLSPIAKKDILDFKIGKQIDAANILSGGENIFEGNDNSLDGNELVIDDKAVVDDKADADRVEVPSESIESEAKPEHEHKPEPGNEPEPGLQPVPAPEPQAEPELELDPVPAPELEPALVPELQLDTEPEIEPALVPELQLDTEPEIEPMPQLELELDPESELENELVPVAEPALIEAVPANAAGAEMEVVLQINGNNLNAIDIGNGLYLYRKDGQDELAAIQIIGDDPLQNYKLLKVRDNAEGNLEVYEEIEVEVPKEVPTNEAKPVDKNTSHVPIVDVNKVMSESSSNKVADIKHKSPQIESVASTSSEKFGEEKETSSELKTEVNVNGRMMKFSESRKSPVVGSFTPMTFHSTPNKEGKPLTKTMVDLQLDPNRHSDNVKKTIEVHTDSVKQKSTETATKDKDKELIKSTEAISKQILVAKSNENTNKPEIKDKDEVKMVDDKNTEMKQNVDQKPNEITKESSKRKDTTGKLEKGESKDSQLKSNQESTAVDSEADNVVDKEVVPINDDVDHVAVSKEDNSAVDQPPIAKDASNATSFCATNKSVEKDGSKVIKEAVECKSDSVESKIKQDKKKDCEKEKVIKIDEGKFCPMDTIAANSEIVELDPVSDVSSTSTNLEVMPSKVKRLNSCTDGKVENVSSIMMSSNRQRDRENVSDNMTKGQRKIDNTPLVKTALDKPEAKIVQESITETIDQVDSTISTPSQANNNANLEQKTIEISKSVPLLSGPQLKTSDIIEKSIEPVSKIQSFDKLVVTAPEECRSEKKSTSMPVANVKPSVNIAHSTVPLLHPSEKNKGPSYTAGVISSEEAVHPVPITQLKNMEKTPLSKPLDKPVQPISAPDVKPSETQRPSVPQVIPSQNAVVSPMVTDAIPPRNVADSLEMPIFKPPANVAGFVANTIGKSPKEIAKPVTVHATKTHYVDNAALLTPKAIATSAKNAIYSVSMPVSSMPEKVTHLITAPVGKPTEKESKCAIVPEVPSEKATNSTSLSEINKLSSEISDTIIKPARPDAHIPVVANIGNKPSSKHISLINKTEGIKKASAIVPNPNEVMAKNNVTKHSAEIKIESREIKVPIISKPIPEIKPVNNNHSVPVPFGKWTDANRQEFLNKFKEIKVPVSTNSKQIKNSNDLNRRDVLKKIDSQRAQTIINNATAKAQEKLNVKNETVFSNKVVAPKIETKIPIKNESTDKKPKQPVNKVPVKQENEQKAAVSSTVSASSTAITKVEPVPREGKATATMANLIDMTIEDMINRVVVPCKNVSDEPKQTINEQECPAPESQPKKPEPEDSGSLDDIEMKMNELHGIPFVERPPHQLPKVAKTEIKTYSKKHTEKEKPLIKDTKIPKISTSEPKSMKDNIIDIESEDEVTEHEPVTGDIELNKEAITNVLSAQEKKVASDNSTAAVAENDASSKGFITEKDFDKFARRNSITYENCLTVNFDRKEPHSLVQTVKEKDLALHVNPNAEMIRIEPKSKLPHKQTLRHSVHAGKDQGATKFGAVTKDSSSKNYQSKLHSAYQSALTAKHQVAQPITIIEDKPVKVVFVESSTGFIPSQLNVQGQELSPVKKLSTELDNAATNNTDVVDSDLLGVIDENKQQDKTKTKHQRKQVLTPVEAPDLELIQPNDIGIETSPKKRRKIDDNKSDKQSKNMVHKKSYLLGRTTTTDDKTNDKQVTLKDAPKEIRNQDEVPLDRKDAASAIDNLVKAAELLENQAETNMSNITLSTDSQSNTPMKRGRGRPRKYPLPEGAENKTSSPQKKPRLIDAKSIKRASISDEPDDDSLEDDIIRENWTMGKINENIVCPICNKLFRSENVVFKHVKHCTGVSPNRSDSDKSSPRRSRLSQESEDMDYEESVIENKKQSPKKRKSKDSSKDESKPVLTTEQIKPAVDKDEVIVIEDTPIKEKQDKSENNSNEDAKVKMRNRANNLVCEFCDKTFRQLSYLVSHKLQHKKEQAKKTEKNAQDSKKLQVFSCEVCKKEFRKLHHLVQHRIIHNPDVPKRTLRKSSSEQSDNKVIKDETVGKQHEDASAGFRCEPCDKSFRKLHHLVEHRETHDGINRQKPSAPSQPAAEKPPPPQCDICKKTFRKLHHLIEHKEQHADTSSEKSDDKSVKSLSTKDIIHECSLCYMVFPNEHSLNKHSGICSKKKRQSKQPKHISESDSANEEQKLKPEDTTTEQSVDDSSKIVAKEVVNDVENVPNEDDKNLNITSETQTEIILDNSTATDTKLQAEKSIPNEITEIQQKEKDVKSSEIQSTPAKRDFQKSVGDKLQENSVIPEKIKKSDQKENKIQDTPKKKTPLKDKTAPTEAKRKKTIDVSLPAAKEVKPSVESSDDDEVRYMLNPDYKFEDTSEGKTFMKVRAAKRNSLQIERPNSNDHAKRRISLQHPPKISRLKPKIVEPKPKATQPTLKAPEPKPKAELRSKTIETKSASRSKHIGESSETEALLSTDSDDSDVKYSFPKTALQVSKPTVKRTSKEAERKTTRKSMEKRKALVGIAKRKSSGKAITAKPNATDPLTRLIKKRSAQVEHRCDCGQLFTSAALLSRHTSVAHTPPRIRRRRDASPPPPPRTAPRPARLEKNNTPDAVSTRKSSTDPPHPSKKRPSIKPGNATDDSKGGVPDSNSKPPVKTRKSSLAAESATSTDEKSMKLGKKAPSSTGKRGSSTGGENSTVKKAQDSTGKRKNSTVKEPQSSTGKKAESSPRNRAENSTGKKMETSAVRTRRSGVHSGVPVPTKLRKLMQMLNK